MVGLGLDLVGLGFAYAECFGVWVGFALWVVDCCSVCVDCVSWFLAFWVVVGWYNIGFGCWFWIVSIVGFWFVFWVWAAFLWFFLALLVLSICLHSVDFLVGVLVLGGVGCLLRVAVSWFCLFWGWLWFSG